MSDSSNGDAGSVVMLSGDLMFASRVKSVVQRAGLEFRFGGQLPEDEMDSVRFVVLDLSTRSGLTSTIVPLCSERCPQAKLIAFGPHVHVDRLAEARDAGFPMVLTNGQFDSQMVHLFDDA
ncbi:MAG: histidine kinase [Rubripirellula sp.]